MDGCNDMEIRNVPGEEKDRWTEKHSRASWRKDFMASIVPSVLLHNHKQSRARSYSDHTYGSPKP